MYCIELKLVLLQRNKRVVKCIVKVAADKALKEVILY